MESFWRLAIDDDLASRPAATFAEQIETGDPDAEIDDPGLKYRQRGIGTEPAGPRSRFVAVFESEFRRSLRSPLLIRC